MGQMHENECDQQSGRYSPRHEQSSRPVSQDQDQYQNDQQHASQQRMGNRRQSRIDQIGPVQERLDVDPFRQPSTIQFIDSLMQTTLLYNLYDALDEDIFSKAEFKHLMNYLYKTYTEGFYVNAPSKTDFNSPMAVAKYVTRYIGRPAMAQSRITDYDGTYVSYWYQRHEDNEIVNVREHAHNFIKKLIIHIPEKGFNMLRYYGLYAMPNKRTEKLIHLVKREMKKVYQYTNNWSYRIEASFNYNPLKCSCGEYMEFKDLYIPNSRSHPPPYVLKFLYLN